MSVQTIVSADDTVIDLVSGGTSYNALLLRAGGTTPTTILLPSAAGSTAAEAAATVEQPGNGVLLIRDVFASNGVDATYTYNAAAVAEAGAELSAGLSAPYLRRSGDDYLGSLTYFDYDGVTWVASPIQIGWIGGFAHGAAAVLPFREAVTQVIEQATSQARVRGQTVRSVPTDQYIARLIVEGFMAWFQLLPAEIYNGALIAELERIHQQLSLRVLVRGARPGASSAEPQFRGVLLDCLSYGASTIANFFGNPVNAATVEARVERLRRAQIGGVRNHAGLATSPVTRRAFRSEALAVFDDVIRLYGEAIGR